MSRIEPEALREAVQILQTLRFRALWLVNYLRVTVWLPGFAEPMATVPADSDQRQQDLQVCRPNPRRYDFNQPKYK